MKTGGPIIHHLYSDFNVLNNGIEDKRFINIIGRKHFYKNTIKVKHEIYNKSDDIYIWYIYEDKHYVDVWHSENEDGYNDYTISFIIQLPITLFYNRQTPKSIRKLVLTNSHKIKIEWGELY
jgi:hypothetical protein